MDQPETLPAALPATSETPPAALPVLNSISEIVQSDTALTGAVSEAPRTAKIESVPVSGSPPASTPLNKTAPSVVRGPGGKFQKNKGGRPLGSKTKIKTLPDGRRVPAEFVETIKVSAVKPEFEGTDLVPPPPDGGQPQVPDFSDLNSPPVGAPGAVTVEPAPDYTMLSEMLFDMSTGTLAITFGDEWQPRTKDERAHVCLALKTYMAAKKMEDIPPGYLLAIVLIAYSAPRLKEPSTAGKLKLAWAWFKSKLPRKKTSIFDRVRETLSPAPVKPEEAKAA